MKSFLIATLLFSALLFQCAEKMAGITDETSTGTASVYMPGGGEPAKGATVSLFAQKDTSRIPRFLTKTNNEGQFTVTNLSDGVYNLLASKDTLVAYQGEVYVIMGKGTFKNDTLEKQGTLTGKIFIQPNDDPRNIIVNVAGTNIWSNVNIDGQFTLKKLASGEYTLALIPALPQMSGYVMTFVTISVKGGVNDTLKSDLELLYTGVPVVKGLKGSYDTLNNTVSLTWNKPAYRRINSYVVYRGQVQDGLRTNFEICGQITDTFFTQEPIFVESNEKFIKYEYRVAVENNDNVIGTTFESVVVSAINPSYVKQLFSNDTIITYLNLPCTLKVQLTTKSLGSPVNYEWDIGTTGAFASGDSDTVITVSDPTPNKKAACRVSGINGRSYSDTISFTPAILCEKIGAPLDLKENNIYAVNLRGNVMVFDGNKNLWKTSDFKSWEKISDPFPFKAHVRTVSFNNKLVTVDTAGNVWVSEDGKLWDTLKDVKITNAISMFNLGSNVWVIQHDWMSRINPNDPYPADGGVYTVMTSVNLTTWSKYGPPENLYPFSYTEPNWFGTTTDSVIWCFTRFGTGNKAFTTKDMKTIEEKGIIESSGDLPLVSGVWLLFRNTFYSFGKSSYYSSDLLSGWNKIALKNNPFDNDDSNWRTACVVLNEIPYLINKNGAFKVVLAK